jgi:LysR family transcriptional regulator, hydrogen peroxide-inducible genes activator
MLATNTYEHTGINKTQAMTLIELRYLVSLAQERHFGRAAARCCVSQPNLSMAVRKLEGDLGVLLFERSKTGVAVTVVGEQIIAQATRILAQTDVIKALAEAGQDQLSGTLALGIIPTLAPYLLPQLIPQLRLLASNLRLNPEENSTALLREKLRRGELDVILCSDVNPDTDVVSQTIFSEPLVLALPQQHALAAQACVKLADLQGQEVLLLGTGHCLREQVLVLFAGLEAASQPRFTQASSLETLRNMVAAGLGISILPLCAANTALCAPNLLVMRPFAAPAPTRTLSLMWRASFPRHKAVAALSRALQICTWQFTTAHAHTGQGLLVENSNW